MIETKEDGLRFQLESLSREDLIDELIGALVRVADLAAKPSATITMVTIERIKNRFDTIFNNVLCDMKPGWDDSIEGFNKAWDVARDIFADELRKVAQ
jgi:hypothetical protein